MAVLRQGSVAGWHRQVKDRRAVFGRKANLVPLFSARIRRLSPVSERSVPEESMGVSIINANCDTPFPAFGRNKGSIDTRLDPRQDVAGARAQFNHGTPQEAVAPRAASV